LHEVRIRAKRCRYAAEAVAPVVGAPARRFAKRIAAVQDVLGAHHDAVVAAEWLRDAATHAPTADRFAAGALAGMVRLDEEAARAAWPAAWAAARRKQLRSWW
jgi:CHAD domain-containing protein